MQPGGIRKVEEDSISAQWSAFMCNMYAVLSIVLTSFTFTVIFPLTHTPMLCDAGRIVNITDAQKHPQFFSEVDKTTGFHTKCADLLHYSYVVHSRGVRMWRGGVACGGEGVFDGM